MDDKLKAFFMPYHNQKQVCTSISKGVYYLGHFQCFGEILPRHRLWAWNKSSPPARSTNPAPLQPTFRSQDFQERSLDRTLEDLKDCVVLSTTPSYFSQFQNACLLKSRGFQLLEGKCYRHPGYKDISSYNPEHPGCKDRYLHWEHIWWKVIGEPKEIGLPTLLNQMNNCGVDSTYGLEGIQKHDGNDRRLYLTVAWLPRGQIFPKGWKRFYSAQDYKLGVNFDLISGVFKSKVQICDHDFDLKIFENWEPDFDKWSPA